MTAKVCTASLTLLLLAAPLLAEEARLGSKDEKISYSVGYQVGGDFKRQGQPIDARAMVQGAEDALSGAKPALSPEEMNALLVELKQEIVKRQQEERERLAQESAAAGKAFLAENGKREGVKSLPSGLQYEVLVEGEGQAPGATDRVTVHYRGTLVDGTEFDSSYSRNQPATFGLDRVIKGWTEGLQLMKPGAKYKLFVPPELGYGARAAGKIPPNSTLIFEVELLSVGGG